MKFESTSVAGAYVIRPDKISDSRGYFARTWCEQELAERGLVTVIKQINLASSTSVGTLRGLHLQRAPHQEVKIVRCTRGSMFDVVVDLRPESPTFRSWHGVILDDEERTALYVPEGCATGYLTLEDGVNMMYTTSQFFQPDAATGVRYDDPAFGIEWPSGVKVISTQDESWPNFDS